MGNFLESCCKSRKKVPAKLEQTRQESSKQEPAKPEPTKKKAVKVDQKLETKKEEKEKKPKGPVDYFEDYGMSKGFKEFVEKEFDMKNMVKYITDKEKGIYSMEFLEKILTTASYWSFILSDHGSQKFYNDRRKALPEGNNY